MISVALLFLHVAHARTETPVRATLGDGQILMGQVRTRTLRLEGASGSLEIPLADVGEVVPVVAGGLGESEGRVDVWLKNGSELRGTWADPELAMSIRVGGSRVPVDLPMNDLSRFQLQGDARWPSGPVYRMRTRLGDDFLVDPARTQLVLQNHFGTFSPLLSECRMVAPVADPQGLWRIELQTGTVLIGQLQDGQVTVALPMGPAEITVPLDQFVSLRVERWDTLPQLSVSVRESQKAASSDARGGPASEVSQYVELEATASVPGRAAGARRGPPRANVETAKEGGWFDNGALQATKDAQGEGE